MEQVQWLDYPRQCLPSQYICTNRQLPVFPVLDEVECRRCNLLVARAECADHLLNNEGDNNPPFDYGKFERRSRA